jgi:hypothetical protein
LSTLVAVILCFAWDSRAIGQLWFGMSACSTLNLRRNSLNARTHWNRRPGFLSRGGPTVEVK